MVLLGPVPTTLDDRDYTNTALRTSHLTIDINGDGLDDVLALPHRGDYAEVQTNIGTSGRFAGRANTGTLPAQYTPGSTYQFDFGQKRDHGVRVVDVNQDGRDDLLLLGGGVVTRSGSTCTPGRTHINFLRSNGASFEPADLATSIPIGDHAAGCACSDDGAGFHMSHVLDWNGDGCSTSSSLKAPGIRFHSNCGSSRGRLCSSKNHRRQRRGIDIEYRLDCGPCRRGRLHQGRKLWWGKALCCKWNVGGVGSLRGPWVTGAPPIGSRISTTMA